MSFEIRAIAERDIAAFHAVLDSVARERRFLSFLEAPPLDQIRTFVLKNIEDGLPEFVALDGAQMVGWCDILTNTRRTVQAHCGTLGMGVLPPYRGRGLGRALIRRAMDAALAFGLTRIELTVREQNANAIALYKSVGFETEGLHRNAVRIDGRYGNVVSMAFVSA
ncbi:GNAT family N-acetyltransferase [Bradyrhizobium sp. 83012]|uniref:GNAT family N-acetyltransferase n=1 Tax=Bradyrhizobium aeschynomenes TaxID=2734909 RepID=A0ABX2C929_9BRAD|nr:GNAT family N-acetyltransferase [Bradyrhizobium aeschynomenes]NPU12769.1 GNAT family N-acetyltransferase [Bradyrhizobium aeschynomenes]NPU64010.1 GNAT family N-acetyltransferase [Bradyrhizobium aeschynomenes]NPV21071.1 GNAT family N-acetyltransferase [Bradyrhizobium aeschynomenes]